MSRVIVDEDFEEWETYASTNRYGLPEPARIVFRCRTNPRRRPRVVEVEGDRTYAEKLVNNGSGGDLVALLRDAGEVE